MDYIGSVGLDALKGADILREAPKRYSSTIEYDGTVQATNQGAAGSIGG